MSDKPKGLDLSKLLKKDKPAAPVEPAPAPPLPVATGAASEPAPPAVKSPGGLDLGRLMAKKNTEKNKEAEALPKPPSSSPSSTAVSSPPPPRVSPAGEIEAPADSLKLLLGKDPATTGKASTPAKAAPAPKPALKKAPPASPRQTPSPGANPSSKAAPLTPQAQIEAAAGPISRVGSIDGITTEHASTRFVASVEDTSSQQGAQRLRLDVTVGQELEYPRGAFGIDEFFLGLLDWTNMCRVKAWRMPARYKPGFSLHMELTGQYAEQASIVWDGSDLTARLGQLVGEPAARRGCPAEAYLQVFRGVLDCRLLARVPGGYEDGDKFLLYLLGLKASDETALSYQELLDLLEERRDERRTLMRKASDAADYFCHFYEKACRISATKVGEPYMIRVRFDGSPFTEVLFHFENKKLHVLRGKPGESLVEGTAELIFSPHAARVFYQGEADLAFLLRAGVVKASGDLRAFVRCNMLINETIENLRFMAKTGAPVSAQNIRYLPLDLGPVYDAFGELETFG